MNMEELEKLKQIEEMKKTVLNNILSKEAYERLARVRVVNPKLAGQADLYLLQIYQSGKIQETITEDKLKDVLKILSVKKEFKIKRR